MENDQSIRDGEVKVGQENFYVWGFTSDRYYTEKVNIKTFYDTKDKKNHNISVMHLHTFAQKYELRNYNSYMNCLPWVQSI